MAERADVVICGSGSAGLCAATWLARYGIKCKILERRDGPMERGQADGVQCRTVEIFESFGISEELLRESYHVVEVTFWADQECPGSIRRTGRAADTQPGLSHQPHVILNQARINGLLIEAMGKFNGQEVEYGVNVTNVRVDTANAGNSSAYPVAVIAERDGKEVVLEAKYVLACDGAHSVVRKSLGFDMLGDSSDAVWGVMDIIPRTDFPDIRKKTSIRSRAGNLLIIPREGGSLTRFYIELPPGANAVDTKLESLQKQAQKIFSPFQMDFVETIWWSAYSIGQRYANLFQKDHRIFLAGDACHTHSPKAGQGMNVSLQDGYNIGWKIASVLKGLAPRSLLETYVLERRKVAVDLINFDRYFSTLFKSDAHASPAEFQEAFVRAGKYTAGLTAKYDCSSITSKTGSEDFAANIITGMRLPSAQLVRYCDSKPVQLVEAVKSDGRWRVIIFSGDISTAKQSEKLSALSKYLDSLEGPIHGFTRPGADMDSVIEVVLVCGGDRYLIELENIPECFCPITGKSRTRDLHKIYYDDESYSKGHGHAYECLGIGPEGAIVVVRPDQYVSAVLGMDEYVRIGEFFKGALIPQGRYGQGYYYQQRL